MATVKEINQYLKETGYSEADMDRFWNECIAVNTKVRLINNTGRTWKDLPINQIEKLPKLKKKTLKNLKKAQKVEKKAKEEQASEKEIPASFEEAMLQMIDSGMALSERELSNLLEYELEHESSEPDRWTRHITSIVELCGRYFALEWEQGLTEYQANYFGKQPYEVRERTYEKTITVTEWKPVEKEEDMER